MERSYGYCPTCLVGFFPPRRGIGIASEGNIHTEDARRGMVRLATWMPFRQASQELEFFTKVEVNEATIRHTTEPVGAAQVDLQDRRVAEIQAKCEDSPDGPDLQIMSVDGAYIQLVGSE